jgi:hypothetical protein
MQLPWRRHNTSVAGLRIETSLTDPIVQFLQTVGRALDAWCEPGTTCHPGLNGRGACGADGGLPAKRRLSSNPCRQHLDAPQTPSPDRRAFANRRRLGTAAQVMD